MNRRAAKILEHYGLIVGAGYTDGIKLIKFTEFNTNLNYVGKRVVHTVSVALGNHNMSLTVSVTNLIRIIKNKNIKIISPEKINTLEGLNRI